MIQHDQIIFEKLPVFLGEAQFSRMNGKQQKARDYLTSWQDKMGVSQVEINPTRTNGYDTAWTFVYNTRPIGQRRSNSKCDVLIIAVSSTTQKIQILNSQFHNGQISDLRTSSRVEDEIEKYHKELEQAEDDNANNQNAYYRPLNRNTAMKNIRSLDEMFSLVRKNQNHASQLLSQSASFRQIFDLRQMDFKGFESFLRDACDETLQSEFDELSKAINQSLNQQALQWSNHALEDVTQCDKQFPVSTYNWILSAPNEQSQGFRYTAMMQFKFVNELCWDLPIWDNIDNGKSPIKLLADQFDLLERQITPILEERYKDLGYIPEVALYDPGEENIKNAIDRYKNTVSNVKDMKRDVTNRIISPVVLLELEKHDLKVADASVLEPILSQVQNTIWGKSSPSEQLSSSSYWHSERVDIQTRFNSAALTGQSVYRDWHPLFEDEYFETKNGLRLYPLTSTEQLREEGRMMKHCVGSYSSRCFKDNYHIFSIRDQDGKRISTLTVQEYFEASKRSVKVAINLTYNDASAPKEARKAAEDFVEIYNKDSHDFNTNWQAIDLTRAEYKQQEIENAAGYDFRDPTQSQSVFSVYDACLPKKVSRAYGGQFNQLPTALGIQGLVQDFVESFDYSQGGLVRVPDEQPAPQNNGQVQHQRPRIA